MRLKKLGSTDLMISPLGLGTVKFGRNEKVNYPREFALPSDQVIVDLLRRAKSLGINVIDTAPAYGSSEERLGALLQDRHDWVLSTKVGEVFSDGVSHFDFSASAIQASVKCSLQRLKTDYLDIVLVHSNGDDTKIILEDQVFETLAALKQAGLIRAYGMSTKTVEGGLLAVELSDLVMVTHHLQHDAERSVIEAAHAKQKGVFIKKGLASGHLDAFATEDPVQAAMNFIFKEPGVSCVIVGTLNLEHLEHNARCVERALA